MPFQIIRNDITKVHADAIVNTANPKPVIGSGTDSGIYAAAGAEQLLSARKKIGDIQPGQAAETPAFQLDAKYIIHTVGPLWIDGMHGETEVLRSCYDQSLALADKLGCKSIAFPLIATGVYGFPKDKALDIATSAIGKYLLTHDMKVMLVVFDRKAVKLSSDLFGGIEAYIDEHYIQEKRRQEYGDNMQSRRMLEERRLAPSYWNHEAEALSPPVALPPSRGAINLDNLSDTLTETFQQRLFRLIDQRGLDDVTVYKRACVDRKVFSTIRKKVDYMPKKRTALALAIALELNMDETADLLSRAGMALSPSSMTDVILSYCISNQIYDTIQIDTALFRYHQKPLFSLE